jgi:hypothetical protein
MVFLALFRLHRRTAAGKRLPASVAAGCLKPVLPPVARSIR